MLYWAYISLTFVAFQFINALLNFVFPQKIKETPPLNNVLISLLIPARNEEKNIKSLLDNLLKLPTQNIEIIVYDDQSTDDTAKIAESISHKNPNIKLLKAVNKADGWLGKAHACHHLAKHAKGQYLIFIDADVRLYGAIIEEAVAYAARYRLGLLSIFPIQIQKTLGERVAVPVMHYILLTLLPLIFVRRSPFRAHSAANGQFMCFNAGLYHKIQPHKLFKNSLAEDIAIASYLKKHKHKVACITGEEKVKCRMYHGYKEALYGFTKNIFMFFGNKPWLSFLFWGFAALGIVPMLFLSNIFLAWYVAIVISTLTLVSLSSRQNVLCNIFLFPLRLFFLLQLMIKAVIINKRKNYLWKGRSVYA